jgi:hypothetical protein
MVCLLVDCLSITETYPSPNNYNYNAAVALNISSGQSDRSFPITVGFDIIFRGQTYNKFWINSNSVIYFGDQDNYTTYNQILNNNNPRIEINAQ